MSKDKAGGGWHFAKGVNEGMPAHSRIAHHFDKNGQCACNHKLKCGDKAIESSPRCRTCAGWDWTGS